MTINRINYITVTTILIFCLLPFSLWLNYFLPSGAASKIPWREVIVFFFPTLFIVFCHKSVKRDVFYLYLLLLCALFLGPVFYSLIQAGQISFLLVIGLLPYIAAPVVLLFFLGLSRDELYKVLQIVKISLVVGGGGIIVDFMTDYSISRGLEDADIYIVASQTSLVPRASFLYVGSTGAATIIVLMFYLLILESIFMRGYAKSTKVKLLTFVAVVLGVTGMTLTFSRIGFLYIGVFLIFLSFYFYRRFAKHVFYSVLAGGIFFLAITTLGEDARLYLGQRVSSLVVGAHSGEELDLGRTLLLRKGVDDISENFFLGSGIGSGNPRSRGQGFEIAHYENTFLWVINESGIIGFIVFFIPHFLPLLLVCRSRLHLTKKVGLLFLILVMALVVFINPGGASFVVISIYALACSIFWKFLSFRNRWVTPNNRRIK